jgi:ABC-2 type transport system permease protein
VIGVELRKMFRRPRTWGTIAALNALPLVVAILLRVTDLAPRPGEGPAFLSAVLGNGQLFPLAALGIVLPLFLPIAVAVVAGDSVAGEAQAGTLRYLLLRPVRRTRLVLANYSSAMTLLAALVAVTMVTGIVAGAVVFGLGPLPTLSGTTLSVAASLGRVVLTGIYMVAVLSGIASLGLWISTRTDSGPGAAVATIVIAIASQILDQLPSLHVIHPYLPTHGWLAFTGLFRFPVDLGPMRAGVLVSAAYTAVFLTLALVGFRRRDVTG